MQDYSKALPWSLPDHPINVISFNKNKDNDLDITIWKISFNSESEFISDARHHDLLKKEDNLYSLYNFPDILLWKISNKNELYSLLEEKYWPIYKYFLEKNLDYFFKNNNND